MRRKVQLHDTKCSVRRGKSTCISDGPRPAMTSCSARLGTLSAAKKAFPVATRSGSERNQHPRVPVHGGARGWVPGGRYHNYIEYDKRSNNDITIKRMCVWGGADRGGGVYGAVLALASGGAPPHLPPRASARACVRRCVCAGGAYRGWRHRANNPHERRFLLPISSCLLNCLDQGQTPFFASYTAACSHSTSPPCLSQPGFGLLPLSWNR